MSVQDKQVEMEIGALEKRDEWLDHPQTRKVKKRHLELLHIIPARDRLILDVGCGPGTYGIIMAEEGNRVVAMDISRDLVRRANRRGSRKSLTFMPQVSDVERLPFKDGAFDICFSGWMLHHLPDTSTAVRELHRVLRPGGVLALAEPNDSSMAAKFSRFVQDLPLLRNWVMTAGWDTPNRVSHSYRDYVRTLDEQGFADIEVRSCYPGALPPLPYRAKNWRASCRMQLLRFLFHCRSLMFWLSDRLLPRPMNGADLIITAKKT